MRVKQAAARAILTTTLLLCSAAHAQTPTAPTRARRVVAICPLRVDGDAKVAAELDKHLNQTLIQMRIARADPAALADLLQDLPQKRCPEDEKALAQLGRDVGATDILVVRIGLFPVVVGGRLVAADAAGRTTELPPVKGEVKGSRTDSAKQALTAFVRQLPLDDPGILEPLVDPPLNGTGTQANPLNPTQSGNTTANNGTQTPVPPPVKVQEPSSPMPMIVGGGAAALVGAGGIVWGVLSDRRFDDLAEAGNITPAIADEMRSLQLQGAIGRVGGTALLVVGAAITTYGLLQPQPAAKPKVSVVLTPSGAAVFGSF